MGVLRVDDRPCRDDPGQGRWAYCGTYDRLAPDELRPLGLDLRRRLSRAVDAALAVTGHQMLLEANPVLRR